MIKAVKNKVNHLKENLSRFSKEERGFIFFAMLCGFFVCFGYSIVRPVSTSVFISSFSTSFLPYVWIALIPFNFFLVSFYNRLVPKWGSKRLFLTLIAIVIGINLVAPMLCRTCRPFAFFFYMWKEVYVMLMFQLVWSVIHSNIQMKRAKYLYGIFFGIGGCGSMLGSAFPGYFAVSMGSENLLFLSLPIYLILGFIYARMMHFDRGAAPIQTDDNRGGMLQGIALIRRSRFLIFILLIVVFMQLSSAIIEFQFNDFLEKIFSEKDMRTEYIGRIFGIMHALTVVLQLVGTYMLIEWMGLKRAHLFVPTLLGSCACLFLAVPLLPIISLVFITLKASDHSIFTISKEMLYIPLKANEKYQAKAVIDVFAYRSAKGVASLLILFLQLAFVQAGTILTWAAVLIASIWVACVYFGLREYEKVTQESV